MNSDGKLIERRRKNYDGSFSHVYAERFSFAPINLLFKCVKIS